MIKVGSILRYDVMPHQYPDYSDILFSNGPSRIRHKDIRIQIDAYGKLSSTSNKIRHKEHTLAPYTLPYLPADLN